MQKCGPTIFNDCPFYPNAKCVIYTGPNLSAIDIFTNDRLDKILKNINTTIANIAVANGTVTSVAAGVGMSFATITTTGSISLDTTLVPYIPLGFSQGFLKWNGSTWVFDNSTYLTAATAATDYIPYTGATTAVNLGSQTLTTTGATSIGALTGTSAIFSGNITIKSANPAGYELQDENGYYIGGMFMARGTAHHSPHSFNGDLVIRRIQSGLYPNANVIIANECQGDTIFVNQNNNNGTHLKSLILSRYGAATFYSSVTAASFVKSGGTSSQFLKADGSVDASTYLTLASLASDAEALAGVNTTKLITPATLSYVLVNSRFQQTFGDGINTVYTINHNLNTTDVQVEVFEVASGQTTLLDIDRTSANSLALLTLIPPSTNELRVVVSKL